MAPRLWIAGSRFTITPARAMTCAPRVSALVTTTGIISGVRPTATETRNTMAWAGGVRTAEVTASMSAEPTAMNRMRVQDTVFMPDWKLVSGWRAVAGWAAAR